MPFDAVWKGCDVGAVFIIPTRLHFRQNVKNLGFFLPETSLLLFKRPFMQYSCLNNNLKQNLHLIYFLKKPCFP